MPQLSGAAALGLILMVISPSVLYAETASAANGGDEAGETADGESLDNLSVDEISRRLENPLTDLWSLTFQNNLSLIEGDALEDTEVQNNLFFQPFMPFAVGEKKDKMLTFRPVFPLVSNPVYDASEEDGTDGRETGLGDIQMLTLAGPNTGKGLVWGLGATFKLPTASDEALGQDKWQAGPAALIINMGNPWVLGVLAQHWTSFAGDNDRRSTSQTDIQYIARRSIPGGWSIGMGPTVTIDWKADSGEKLTVPIGLGITRTVRWKGKPWKLRLEPQYSVIRPDELGVEWNIRLQVTPVISNPFGN